MTRALPVLVDCPKAHARLTLGMCIKRYAIGSKKALWEKMGWGDHGSAKAIREESIRAHCHGCELGRRRTEEARSAAASPEGTNDAGPSDVQPSQR